MFEKRKTATWQKGAIWWKICRPCDIFSENPVRILNIDATGSVTGCYGGGGGGIWLSFHQIARKLGFEKNIWSNTNNIITVAKELTWPIISRSNFASHIVEPARMVQCHSRTKSWLSLVKEINVLLPNFRSGARTGKSLHSRRWYIYNLFSKKD